MSFDAAVAGLSDASVLVVGADGTIGRALASSLERSGLEVWRSTRRRAGVAPRNIYIDLHDDPGAIPLPAGPVGVAFLCAAITDIARCQKEPAATRRVNVDNTLVLAGRLVAAGVFTVFLSSNTVFDGQTAFEKTDAPCRPKTEYGRQKAEVEQQLLGLGDRIAVVRMAKILAPDAPLMVGWIRDLRAGRPVHPFVEGAIAPVSVAFAVDLLMRVAQRRISGITQMSANQDMSYVAAARYIAARLGAGDELVQPISKPDAGVQEFPKYTTLDSSRAADLGLVVPPPFAALDQLDVGPDLHRSSESGLVSGESPCWARSR